MYDTGERETSDNEDNLEERVLSKVKRLFRNKDCVVILSDHIIRTRTRTRNAEV